MSSEKIKKLIAHRAEELNVECPILNDEFCLLASDSFFLPHVRSQMI